MVTSEQYMKEWCEENRFERVREDYTRLCTVVRSHDGVEMYVNYRDIYTGTIRPQHFIPPRLSND